MRKFYVFLVILLLILPLSYSEAQESEQDILKAEERAVEEARLKIEANAKITPADIVGAFSLMLSPKAPRPAEIVTVSIDGSGLDFDTANITWSVNSKKVRSGRGVKIFSLVVGSLGSRTTVGVRIETGTDIFEKSIVITPAEVDLLWQGNTYVPPFYKGRALWSSQSVITFMAIPQGVGASPLNLIYRWTKNGTVMGNASGTGRNSLVVSDTILSKPQTIKIDVLADQNTLLASASITLTPISPILAIYENNPLYGFLFHREINGTHQLEDREITFTAFPLFFSASNRADQDLNYEWRTNVGETETRNSVTYRSPDNTAGSSQVRVRAFNLDKIMEDTDKSFLVQFGNE